ncbi:MAG: methyltransferase domain-containing protein [Rhodospirillaceae bacterium]|nr:methyltransferase domain-containing protein [Rhodospirillaceae bacterium]
MSDTLAAADRDDPFELLFADLPRQGPGSKAMTLAALAEIKDLPDTAVVLDLGCGTGGQTLVLAQALRQTVRAVDTSRPFLKRLEAKAKALKLGHYIDPYHGEMLSPPIAPESADLLWCEGAAYAVGFETALKTWWTYLKPGGWLAISECHWLSNKPPEAARAFWQASYPDMTVVEAGRQTAQRLGFTVDATLLLPKDAWLQDYYHPLEARISEIKPTASRELRDIIENLEREIHIFRQFGDSYGYAFHIFRRPLDAV